jgi:hypothetical protein
LVERAVPIPTLQKSLSEVDPSFAGMDADGDEEDD